MLKGKKFQRNTIGFGLLALFGIIMLFTLAECGNSSSGDPSSPADPYSSKTLISIRISSPPAKIDYDLGQDLDLTGMVVTATYGDNFTQTVTGYTQSGYNKTKTGTQTVTVTYQKKTAAFTVNVKDPALPSLYYPGRVLASGTVRTNYSANLAGATAIGTSPAITYTLTASSNLPDGLSFSAPGSVTGIPTEAISVVVFSVTASASGYNSAVAYFTISINEAELAPLSGNVSITVQDGKAVTGCTLVASYSGSESVSFQWNLNGAVLAGKTGSTLITGAAGVYTVTVSTTGYTGKTSGPCEVGQDDAPELTGAVSISVQGGGQANTGCTLLAAYTGGTESITFNWYRDGVSLGKTGSFLETSTPGSYTVTVNADGYLGKTSSAVTVSDINVIFSNLVADGSASSTTTKLTLTFDRVISGLTADDITVTHSVPGQTVQKGALSVSGSAYTLPISGFTASGTVTVTVAKAGYAISNSQRSFNIYYMITVLWDGNQNGSYTASTTSLSLTFNQTISGLTASDFIITHSVPGQTVQKGTLSVSGSVYTLPISGFNVSGTLTIKLEKPGYTASPSSINLPVYYQYFTNGNGLLSNPYQISTAAQLAKLAELVNSGDANYNVAYYRLSSDIDLSAYGAGFNGGKGWTPIGKTNLFFGHFDGNGRKITGLYINDTALSYAGLFGVISGSEIKNLGVENMQIRTSERSGGIAGYTQVSNIQNCYTTGEISVANSCVGGITSGLYQNSTMSNCYSAATVTGSYAGGITGTVEDDSSLTSCYSTGIINGTGICIGGISGYSNGGHITQCAALNQSIISTDNGVERVLGVTNYITLTNNLAWDGIVNSSGTTAWYFKGANEKDGEDISAADIMVNDTLGGRFTSANGWTTQNGKLPGLFGNTVDIPAYMLWYVGTWKGSSETLTFDEDGTMSWAGHYAGTYNFDEMFNVINMHFTLSWTSSGVPPSYKWNLLLTPIDANVSYSRNDNQFTVTATAGTQTAGLNGIIFYKQ